MMFRESPGLVRGFFLSARCDALHTVAKASALTPATAAEWRIIAEHLIGLAIDRDAQHEKTRVGFYAD
jgi:hypothetical protein